MEDIQLNKEFAAKLNELGVLDQYLDNLKSVKGAINIETANQIFLSDGASESIECSFIHTFTPEGVYFWKDILDKLTILK